MQIQKIKEIILKELPKAIEKDPMIRTLVIEIASKRFADKDKTEDKFDRMLEELKKDREENMRKWEENQKKWEENQKKWEENQKKWEENQKKWEENQKQWKKNTKQWEKNTKQWEENQKAINKILDEIKNWKPKFDSTIGALGARWGLHTEESFRNALKGILEDYQNIEVLHVTEFDDTGEVFGHPDQIELDLIIKNGKLFIGEIKSSMSKGDMYIFERKARFYEKKHGQKASKLFVISPMVDPRAIPVAEKLGIDVYSWAEDVKL